MTLREFLNTIYPISDDVMDDYLSHWEDYNCPRKTVITVEGQIERYMYFVEEGLQKSYYLNDGKMHVIAFTYPPSFCGVPESFFSQTPSRYFLETITESKFIRIPYQAHQDMMAKHRAIETLFRKATEIVLTGVLERHYELMAYSIEDRLRLFVQRSPHMLNMVPHKDLASYLRIDPTNFSKLLGSIEL